MNPVFFFTLCQVGAEKALKDEMAAVLPTAKFAYSRPGFLTFKADHFTPKQVLNSVFARCYGLNVAKFKTPAEVIAFIDTQKADHVHIIERDSFLPGDEPLGFKPGAFKQPLLDLIRRPIQTLPKLGDTVLDVVCVMENEFWIGTHVHHGDRSPFVGGKPEIKMPEESPSRAYLKMEDMLQTFAIPVKKNQIIYDIGSAPGGASYALLQRGLKVIGIDPGEMSPIVLNNPRFKHYRSSINQILRDGAPDPADWIALDMNVKPEIALTAIEKFVKDKKPQGLLLTLKINDWALAKDIPKYLKKIFGWGFSKVEARQLGYNRQEITVVARV